jgi:hypothetical protein
MWLEELNWIWIEKASIQIDLDSIEKKWDANWCKTDWKFAYDYDVDKKIKKA